MKKQIILQELAQIQIIEALERYNAYSRENGDKFWSVLEAQTELLLAFLFSSPEIFDEVRRALLKGFSYQLLYAVRDVEGERHIVILACVHERSNPQTWCKV